MQPSIKEAMGRESTSELETMEFCGCNPAF
jgi:hypothetical protein